MSVARELFCELQSSSSPALVSAVQRARFVQPSQVLCCARRGLLDFPSWPHVRSIVFLDGHAGRTTLRVAVATCFSLDLPIELVGAVFVHLDVPKAECHHGEANV